MALRPITETCEPRSDVMRGGLTDAHFAAQLDQVVRNPTKYPVYGDPTEFFAITYPTQGLKDLLTSTFGRLSGKGGNVPGAEHAVARFQTSFGGGKTHGLIAAYHLATGARPVSIGEFVDPDLLPDRMQVAAVVGDALDAVTGLELNGHRVLTMWGAIAAQLGDEAWTAVAPHDAARSAPGSDIWRELFEEVPTLVIIDEVAAQLRALSSSGDPDVRRQADAMPSFLFNLFSAAAQVPTARVIITLATERDAFGRETSQVEKVLDESSVSARETQSVMSRYREILVPAADDEIAEILRRRLFSRIEQSGADEAAEEYERFYAELENRDVRLGWSPDIIAGIRRSYPLHPELVQVLDSRVGTIPDFQRTRGALRLLAETVAALWNRPTSTFMINAADLPLDAAAVGNSLTRGIGRELYGQVIEADVAGSGSHAHQVDQERFSGKKPYATRSATVVFLHSLEQTAATGATLKDVWRGALAPGDDPDLVEEALRSLDLAAWHFAFDGGRYRFQVEPNAKKIVEDEKSAVPNSMMREELDRRIGQIFASANPIKVRTFPSGPADVDDRPELQLAVMHYDHVSVGPRTASPPPMALVEILDTHGVAASNRTYRNGVAFLVADSEQIEAMREQVRYHMAAKRITDDSSRMQSYAPEVQKKLREITDKAGLDARVAVTRCYRHLYYPKADNANHHLRHHELPPRSQGDQAPLQTPVIQEALGAVGKIRSVQISTDFLAAVAGFPATDPLPTNQISETFWRNHDADLILNPTLIQDALIAGTRNGSWIYYDADTEKAYTSETPPPSAGIGPTKFLYTQQRAEEAALLRRDPSWDDLQRELLTAGGQLSGTELRTRLEKALKAEPSKASIQDILGRVMKQEEAPVIVVEGEATSESKPIPVSTVSRLALDRLTILSRERALELGISIVDRPSGFRLQESGVASKVFATLADKLSELGHEKRIDHIEIQINKAGVGVSDLRTLLAAPPMLPRYRFGISLTASGAYEGLTGDVSINNLAGSVVEFKKVEKLIMDVLDRAADVTLLLAISHTPDTPIAARGEEWKAIATTISDLQPGVVDVTVRGR